VYYFIADLETVSHPLNACYLINTLYVVFRIRNYAYVLQRRRSNRRPLPHTITITRITITTIITIIITIITTVTAALRFLHIVNVSLASLVCSK
jgi:formate hydrogenlyase subunit 4